MAKLLVSARQDTVRISLVKILQARGHKILETARSIEAVDIAQVENPDLIICFWSKNEFGATRFCQALKNDNRTEGIPVYLIIESAEMMLAEIRLDHVDPRSLCDGYMELDNTGSFDLHKLRMDVDNLLKIKEKLDLWKPAPIQRYSVFISYSHRDEGFAKRLHDTLQSNDVRCWYSPEDIQGGKKLHEQIDEAIRVYDKLLLILSEHSMNSNWVEFEIRRARKREVQEKR